MHIVKVLYNIQLKCCSCIMTSYVLVTYLTFLLLHCGPCDNFCYLGHIKKLVDDDDDDDIAKVNIQTKQIHCSCPVTSYLSCKLSINYTLW